MSEPSPSRILAVEYYDGAYGPTIRIEIDSLPTLLDLRTITGHLAGGAHSHTKLVDGGMIGQSRILMSNMTALTLAVFDAVEPMKVLTRDKTIGQLSFQWMRDPLGWTEVAEKIDALIEHGCPAHQYLTIEGTDDALVELSLMGG